MNAAKNIARTTRFLRVAMFILAAIGIAMVIRRTLTINGLIPPFTPPGTAPFDTGFGRHPIITYLHILPGLLFMILGPLQFIPGVIASYQRPSSRWSRRVFLAAAWIVGLSALFMPFMIAPIGGINEAAASMLFALLFLVSLGKTTWYQGNGNQRLYREWLIRAFAIGLAIATIRPIMGLFFAFSGLPPQVFFGTAFWIGFTLHAIVAETWINYTRKLVALSK